MQSKLTKEIREEARENYKIWIRDPYNSHLNFKKIGNKGCWSIRISPNSKYRALGILENDTILWFWIGHHKVYDNLFTKFL